jgi:hypothetical protein
MASYLFSDDLLARRTKPVSKLETRRQESRSYLDKMPLMKLLIVCTAVFLQMDVS